jgi:hypothetical protein
MLKNRNRVKERDARFRVGTDEDNAGRPIAPLSGFERIGTTYRNWVNMLDLAHRGHLGGYFPSIYCSNPSLPGHSIVESLSNLYRAYSV